MNKYILVWFTSRGTFAPVECYRREVFTLLDCNPFDIVEDAFDNWTRDDLTGLPGNCCRVRCAGHLFNIADEGALADIEAGDYITADTVEEMRAKIEEKNSPADAARMLYGVID